ncbi:MAG TPA: response regulator, partial [Pyrinomonadaceae bacterium]
LSNLNRHQAQTTPLAGGVSLAMRKHRILYVEDHEDTRDLITLVLQQRDYDVVTADTIAAALTLANGGLFDLYL